MLRRLFWAAVLGIAAWGPERAHAQAGPFAAPASTAAPTLPVPYQGQMPLPQDRGPWVIGDVRFQGEQAVSEFALSTRVRARRGSLYTPSDIAGDLAELKTVPGVLSAKADLYHILGEPVPDNYASIAVSTTMVRLVFTIEEKPLFVPGLAPPPTGQPWGPAKAAEAPPASLSGIVLTPTAYRGLGRDNRPGLGLDVNVAYFIGRLYGKNSLPYTTNKTNYIDRVGVLFLGFDGKMQIQSEGTVRPAVAAGAQANFNYRDAPQPALKTVSLTVNPASNNTRVLTGAYVVASKNIAGLRSSLGFMAGDAGNMVGMLSEFLTDQALIFDNHPGQTATSKSTAFASLLFLPTPSYPLAVEFMKPNGMPLNPWLLNFKLGHFLKLNFDLSYLKFTGGWDMLGTFVFRYTEFPKRK